VTQTPASAPTSPVSCATVEPIFGEPLRKPYFTRNLMSAILLWLLVIAVGVYLLVAILRPDKF